MRNIINDAGNPRRKGKTPAACLINACDATHKMKIQRTILATLLCGSWLVVYGQSSDSSVKPDNTKVNKRDRSPSEPTADQQKTNPADRELTKKIRQAIIADKSLSTYAHNVKIISQNGIVTLKGPVGSEDERKSIESKATTVVGSADKVKDMMSVKP